MRRWVTALAPLAVLAMVAAGCGGDDSDNGGSAGGSSDRTTTAKRNLEGQTVEVAAVWSGKEQANFGKVLAQFEKDTGAKVTFTSTGDDIATVLGTRLEGGDPPDIAFPPQPGLLRDLVARNALKPVDDIAGKLVDEHFSKDWRDLATVDGKLYGVPFKAANKSTVWYRKKAFDDAGVEIPKTWDDFLKAAQTIRDSGVTPLAIGGGDGWTLTDWFENVYLRVAGPEKYDQLSRHEIPWTDPTVITALQKLSDLWSKRDLIAPGFQNMTFPESVTTVFRGDAAMVFEGDFVAATITDETDAKLGTDADFFPFPSVDGSDPMVVGGGDVAVLMTDNEAAKELIKYLASPEAAQIWVELGGFTSPNKDVDLSAYPDEIGRKSAQQLVEAKTFRFDLSDLLPSAFGGTPAQGMWKDLQDFLANPANVQGTAQTLERDAAAATK